MILLIFLFLPFHCCNTIERQQTQAGSPASSAVDGWCFFYTPSGCQCEDLHGNIYLKCSTGHLYDIPDLIEDSKWQQIDLKGNPIGKLNKYEFAKIVVSELDLSNCSLTSIHRNAFAMSKGIEKLSLANNLLQLIPSDIGKHLDRLQWLDVSYNNMLTKIDFVELIGRSRVHLRTLILDGLNNLTGADLASLNELETLSMKNMSLKTFPGSTKSSVKLPTRLRFVDLTYNTIDNIEIGSGTVDSIQRLDLSHNKLNRFPAKLASSNLKLLNVSNNNISEVSGWAVQGLPALEELWINNNTISKMSPSFLCGASSNLTNVHLSWNNLTSFPICAIASKDEGVVDDRTRTVWLRGDAGLKCSCPLKNANWTIKWFLFPRQCSWNGNLSNGSIMPNCSEEQYVDCSGTCGADNGLTTSATTSSATSSSLAKKLFSMLVLACSISQLF